MKKIILFAVLLLSFIGSIAQTIIQPPTAIPEPESNSMLLKVGLALGAIGIMALIFYAGKHFKNRKKS